MPPASQGAVNPGSDILSAGFHQCQYYLQYKKEESGKCLEPVSYTHLDVYKRQEGTATRIKGKWMLITTNMNEIPKQENAMTGDGNASGTDIYPVSYTHLDVYKRQAMKVSAVGRIKVLLLMNCWHLLL